MSILCIISFQIYYILVWYRELYWGAATSGASISALYHILVLYYIILDILVLYYIILILHYINIEACWAGRGAATSARRFRRCAACARCRLFDQYSNSRHAT